MTVLQALKRIPDGLFWSAPLASDSDFTAEDPLALDYLGQQVGLWLFRGFTTRTSRAQNYAVVLYGLDLADKAVRQFGYPGDDETRVRLFERWERFWALATLEYRKGQLSRGDEDAMRGVRGATRAWFPGEKPLPTDFALISRQSELGGLGAYLSSLREYGLVFPGSLRVTPAAPAILESFWSEKGERDTKSTYEDYALRALNFETTAIPRLNGRLSLAGLGARSCLSSIVCRSKQQERLWNALFVVARDGSTLPLAECLIAAHRDGVTETEPLLEGMMADRWQPLTQDNKDKVNVALLFGRIARLLLQRFRRAYGHVDKQGWVADFEETAAASFPENEANELRQACAAMLEAVESKHFGNLQFHGPDFLKLLRGLVSSTPKNSLEHMLAFHRAVQRSRRGAGAWLREEQGKLVMQVAGYSGYADKAPFPPLKVNVVRQLLADLGKLQ
ncbi:hypothetical protein AWB78_05852 [Caballeronia calidae]|uniref:Uncharacterized protein n=1 Tax=Caballeronia calidae TaxID=1777139 RepID=A0A158DZ72_9BURK|nr:hypothetical protein [Caballeronia calidae]SAK99912.1 hypothetical protein AWB78_05852 [Caballeronia calidae]